MEIAKKMESGTLIVAPHGRIDTVSAPEFGAALTLDGVNELVVDLSQVPYMSSAGLRCLLVAHKGMVARGGSLKLRGLQPMVLEVLNLTGFSGILEME